MSEPRRLGDIMLRKLLQEHKSDLFGLNERNKKNKKDRKDDK